MGSFLNAFKKWGGNPLKFVIKITVLLVLQLLSINVFIHYLVMPV